MGLTFSQIAALQDLEGLLVLPFAAGSDLSGNQYQLVKAAAPGNGLQLVPVASYLDQPLAVCSGAPNAQGVLAEFVVIGATQIFAGAVAPTYGQQVVMDAAGNVIPLAGAPDGSWLVGVCLSDGASPGDVILCFVDLVSPRQVTGDDAFAFFEGRR